MVTGQGGVSGQPAVSLAEKVFRAGTDLVLE